MYHQDFLGIHERTAQMPVPRLTAAAVEKLKPHPKWPREVYDAALPGFGIRIMPSGVKTWLLKYQRPGSTRRTKLSLGNIANMTLASARAKAAELQAEIAKGADPAAVKRTEHTERKAARITFGWIAESYIKRECPRLARGKEVESTIRRELFFCCRIA